MQLRQYIDSKGLKIADAAREAGFSADEYEAFRKWVKGERIPRPKSMRKIEAWSDGKVTATDFFSAAA